MVWSDSSVLKNTFDEYMTLRSDYLKRPKEGVMVF